jgi:hypothetical protein
LAYFVVRGWTSNTRQNKYGTLCCAYHPEDDKIINMANQLTTDERLDKIDAQLDRIAAAVVSGFERVDKALEAKADKSDLQRVYDLLDRIAKQQEIDDDERLVMGHQLERLDRWVHGVAKKIGYELTI